MNDQQIRVRFAPSPTGPLHIGGVRTALYNYLFARKNGGKMILRIEDTDKSRFVEGAEKYIIESFSWCGIDFDEGVLEGGPYGPYRQSERKDIYQDYALELVKNGFAYYAFDTPEELDGIRKKYEQEKKTFTYNAVERDRLRNSLTLDENTVNELLEGQTPYVIRFKIPENETIVMHDLVRGKVEVNTSVLDDKILYKSDGMPTYHLANIVDDHLMEISHVIRGEEWLPSLPLHVLLYKAFGWQLPQFVHLPLLLKPEGNGKLSKRDGDRLGFPVFPLRWTDPKSGEVSSGYREDGYFPEAFINMLALLGWNPGTDQELFSLDELTEVFSLERVGKSGAKFDPDKAKWFNHQYLIRKADEELSALFIPVLESKGISIQDEAFVNQAVGLVKERASFVSDLWENASFFFVAPDQYDPKAVKKRWKDSSSSDMKVLKTILEQIEDFSSSEVETVVIDWINKNEFNMGAIMNAFRLLVVGALKGPHLFDIVALIGKQETISRIEKGIKAIELMKKNTAQQS